MKLRTLAAIFFILVSASVGYGQADGKPDGYTRWSLSIPAETKVFVESPFGTFNVPIAYLNNRLSFHQNAFGRHNGVTRYDALERQKWSSVSFSFWYPEGGWVWHSNPNVRRWRPIEPGHTSVGEPFVVQMFQSAEFADWQNIRRRNVTRSIDELDIVLTAVPRLSGMTAYQGVTLDTQKKRLHFHLDCEKHACLGWMTIERRNMTMQIFVPSDAVQSMFGVVQLAASLLDTWEADARNVQ